MRRLRAQQALLQEMHRLAAQLIPRHMHRGQRHLLNRRQIKSVNAHHRDILRHPQATLLQCADGAGGHKIAAHQEGGGQRPAL